MLAREPACDTGVSRQGDTEFPRTLGRRVLSALLLGGIALLPFVCWPSLERAFSTPKLWLLVLLSVVAGALLVLRRREAQEKSALPAWPALVWVAAVALSTISGAAASLPAFVLAVAPLPLCWALRHGAVPANRVRTAILLGSAAVSTVAVLQYCGLDPFAWFGWVPETFSTRRMRVYGTLGNPDFVAAWLCATLPLYNPQPQGRRSKLLWSAGLLLQVLAILATGSRVLLLAAPVALVAIAVRRRALSKWFLAAVPLLAIAVWLSPARPLGATVEGRTHLARVALSHWKEVPLLGYGPGAFRLEFAGWQLNWLKRKSGNEDAARFAGPVDHAHNDYVEFFVDYGFIGLAAFLVLCGWLGLRAWKQETGAARAAGAGIWGAAAGLAALACADFPFQRPAEWALFWILLGLLGGGLSPKPRPGQADTALDCDSR